MVASSHDLAHHLWASYDCLAPTVYPRAAPKSCDHFPFLRLWLIRLVEEASVGVGTRAGYVTPAF